MEENPIASTERRLVVPGVRGAVDVSVGADGRVWIDGDGELESALDLAIGDELSIVDSASGAGAPALEATVEGVGEQHATRDGRGYRKFYLVVGSHARTRVRLRPDALVLDAPPPGFVGAKPPPAGAAAPAPSAAASDEQTPLLAAKPDKVVRAQPRPGVVYARFAGRVRGKASVGIGSPHSTLHICTQMARTLRVS